MNLHYDWRQLKQERALRIVRSVEGGATAGLGGSGAADASYVITVDNLLKMLTVQSRLKHNLPVCIMGETGCGKSALISQARCVAAVPEDPAFCRIPPSVGSNLL